MSDADKRTVHTDALATLGTIITPNEKRDAIHLAVLPVRAFREIEPGGDVALLPDGITAVPVDVLYGDTEPRAIGIADPFLGGYHIMPGQWFWLVIYPRKITSLRHVWSHPGVPDAPAETQVSHPSESMVLRAREAIMEIAAILGLTYEETMEGAKQYIDQGEYLVEGGRWDTDAAKSADMSRFWPAYEVLTGVKAPFGKGDHFFTCSC